MQKNPGVQYQNVSVGVGAYPGGGGGGVLSFFLHT